MENIFTNTHFTPYFPYHVTLKLTFIVPIADYWYSSNCRLMFAVSHECSCSIVPQGPGTHTFSCLLHTTNIKVILDQSSRRVRELVIECIIEPVKGPTTWINPIVIVPLLDCMGYVVRTRQLSEKAYFQRRCDSTRDEWERCIWQCGVINTWVKDITKFVTHCALYTCKGLLCGVSSASNNSSESPCRFRRAIKYIR